MMMVTSGLLLQLPITFECSFKAKLEAEFWGGKPMFLFYHVILSALLGLV